VKIARAVVSTSPGLAQTLAANWKKATRFYARFSITEAQFRNGVPPSIVEDKDYANSLLSADSLLICL